MDGNLHNISKIRLIYMIYLVLFGAFPLMYPRIFIIQVLKHIGKNFKQALKT